MKLRSLLMLASVLLGSTLAALLVSSQRASAEYVEYSLIADNYFLDAASMSQQGIQEFLQARGGYLASYSSYSDRDGGNVSAAQIIYEAAQDYGISPKVVLATLQKEQSLVTAKNPVQSQINFAMGYGCPDSADCQAKYIGLYKQIDNATWQFRFNFERARGNNTWWRASLSFPCAGATRYYSTGLYPGRGVTFYDDNGTAIKGFTINNASTSSLYCYTPHPYNNPSGLYGNPQFGYTGQYYSGSYNFVHFYEMWFGSTQPSVTIASPLRISSLPEGIFAGTPTTASFDLGNNTANPITVNVAITVRDGNNTNQDFALKTITVPPYGWATYSDTKTFSGEGNYTFGLTSLTNGVWRDDYPTSAFIDNPRTKTASVRVAPTITVAPASNVTDMRVGKASNLSFTIKNNSAQSMDLGRVALALRNPANQNVDLPLRLAGTVAAGATYTYNEPFTPTTSGTYNGFVVYTGDNGATWDDRYYPVAASGVSRTISLPVKPSPTLTAGPTLSVASPRVGQQVTASFKVKNFGDATVNAGYIGLAIRDPYNRSVDAAAVQVSVAGGSEYTFQANKTFQTSGVYTAWVTSYHNNYWDDTGFPTAESGAVTRKVTFTVLPSPTLTAGPTLSVASPRVGQQVTTSFKVKNFGDATVNAGYIGLAIRDPYNRSVDAAAQAISVNSGSEFTFQSTKTFQTPGTYTVWVTSYHDGYWDDTGFPTAESGAITRKTTFTVLPSPTLTGGVTSSASSPHVGQSTTLSYKVKNYGSSVVDLGYLGLAGRDAQNHNVDPGSVPVVLNPGEERTISFTVTLSSAGDTRYFITSTKDFIAWYNGPTPESSSSNQTLTVTVAP